MAQNQSVVKPGVVKLHIRVLKRPVNKDQQAQMYCN